MATLLMMVGLPGSGKSSIARRIANDYLAPIFSSDEIRKELYGDELDTEHNDEIFAVLKSRIKEFLKMNEDEDEYCIYDACNISYKRRIAFLRELSNIKCRKICCFVYKPFEQCVIDNESRDRVVPRYAIERMYKNFYIPAYYEGWDAIMIEGVEPFEDTSMALTKLFYGENGLCKIPHENPHHTLSIGNHCIQCYMNVIDKLDPNMSMAALLHDIGKEFTKGFVDSKGEPCETAHYYQHHLVSAYNAVPYVQLFSHYNQIEILNLIQWHMFPYFWEKDNNKKMENKYRKIWGDYLFDKIMVLHLADKKAH